jgi:hypothetical protein
LTDQFRWADGTIGGVVANTIPAKTIYRSTGLNAVAITLAIIGGLLSSLLHYLIYLNHSHEIIKASSPVFCHIIIGARSVLVVLFPLSSFVVWAACSLFIVSPISSRVV